MRKLFRFALACLLCIGANDIDAQISGEFQSNTNFFQRDSAVKAYGNPLYDNYLSGGEHWLALRYNGDNGFNASMRIDAFQNSNLLNPTNAYTAAGIGMFNVSKEWDKLTLTAGHVYDQIGSGILFRAYENRALLIDNALFGIHAKYALTDKLTVKGFSGQTRNLFDKYKPTIKGFNLEGDYDYKKSHFTPGIGIVNRTLDKASMDNVVNIVNALGESDRFIPRYNYYAGSIYNTLTAGNFNVYTEVALKSKEAIKDFRDSLINKNGSVYYANAGWSKNKVGITVAAKRTENFALRTSPNEPVLRAFTNWQPVMAAIRPQRVIARYTPQSQDLSEKSIAASINYAHNEKYSYSGSYTAINDLKNTKLYREVFAEMTTTAFNKLEMQLGYQYLDYNQEVYQLKGKYFKANTVFADATYKLSETRSLQANVQYMHADGDYGSWAYALLEYDVAPHWSFAVGDMYNTAVGGNAAIHPGLKAQHYPNVFTAYSYNAHRFTAQYVKQVEGINCTGGVCRYEPAFSGFKLGITSSF